MMKENRMENGGNGKGKGSLAVLLLRILTVAGLITFIGGLLLLRQEMKDAGYTPFDKSRMIYTIEEHAYGTLLDTYYEYAPALTGDRSVDQEAVALAEYTDAALQEKVFLAAGEKELARRQSERKEEARARTGIYQAELEQIDRQLPDR